MERKFEYQNVNYIDVGCSGGPPVSLDRELISSYVGVDPYIGEIKRLREVFPEYSFVIGFVGEVGGGKQADDVSASTYHLERTTPFYAASALTRPCQNFMARLLELRSQRIAEAKSVSGTDFDAYWAGVFSAEDTLSPRLVTFEEIAGYVPLENVPLPWVLKIDTDGSEMPVLRSLCADEHSLSHILGIDIEAQFHGPTCTESSTFSNIDCFLRGLGFSLVDIDVVRYSHSALPTPFANETCPADSLEGTPQWANCKYLRLEQVFQGDAEFEDIVKLASVCNFWNQVDWKADLLLTAAELDPLALNELDVISRSIFSSSWHDLQAQFSQNPLSVPQHARMRRRAAVKAVASNLRYLLRSCLPK